MNNHPFKRFGIEHLSPSSLNCWRASPGVWALRYIARIKDDGNAAMWRGSAVENGLAAFLRRTPPDEALTIAYQAFDLNCQGEISDEITAERSLIAPMLDQCFDWQSPSMLSATQLRVEHWFNDIPIPVIGYLDFSFDGIDIDLKTTKALPSAPRSDHIRQVSLYRATRARDGGLLYVTGKKKAYYPVTDEMMDGALGDLESDARSLMSFLSRCDSPRDVVTSLPMDRENFLFPKKPIPADLFMAG